MPDSAAGEPRAVRRRLLSEVNSMNGEYQDLFLVLLAGLGFLIFLVIAIVITAFNILSAVYIYQRGHKGLAKTIFILHIPLAPVVFLLSLVLRLLLRDSLVVEHASPRQCLRDMAESPPISTIFIVLFVLLTAVSILGGIALLGPYFLYYQIVLALLPDNQYGGVRISTSSPSITTSQSKPSYGESSPAIDRSYRHSESTSDDDYRYSHIERGVYESDDDDDDRDRDDDRDSTWDGWLIKW